MPPEADGAGGGSGTRLPTCPCSSEPQQRAVPSVVQTQACLPPAARRAGRRGISTGAALTVADGVGRGVVVEATGVVADGAAAFSSHPSAIIAVTVIIHAGGARTIARA